MPRRRDPVDKLARLLSARPELIERLPANKRQLAEAFLARRKRATEVPLLQFTPHEKQQAILDDTHRVRLVAGGNRSGKTHVGAAIALSNALGYFPWKVPGIRLVPRSDGTFDFPERERVPESAWVRLPNGKPMPVPNVGVVISGQGLRVGITSVIVPKFEHFLSRAVSYRIHYVAGRTPVRMELPNGSSIFFASPDQSRLAFEGWSAAWAWIDEPVPSHLVGAIWRGLVDVGGPLIFTLTPLGAEARWIFSEFGPESKREDSATFYMALEDNPHLDRDALKSFDSLTTWSDAERAARLYGHLECAVDTVFPSFDSSVHVIDPEPIPPEAVRILSVDPHSRRPWYCLWLACVGNVWTAYRELPAGKFFRVRETSLSVRDWAEQILAAEEQDGARPDLRVIDPRAGMYPQQAGSKVTTLIQQLADHGLVFVGARSDSVEAGLQAITELLQARPPRLRIFKTCPHLIAAMKNLSFRPALDNDDRALVERLSELYKDPVDALRYAIRFQVPARVGTYSYLSESLEDVSHEVD